MYAMIKNLTQIHKGMKRTCFLAVFLCLCTMLFCACERKIKEANLRILRPDMTTKEVESVLGAPNRIEIGPELVTKEVKTLPGTRYVYEQNGQKIELLFFGDRLVESSKKGVPFITGSFTK